MKSIVSEKIELKIPFFDCDPMAVCWHGHYVKYFELARCELFDKIDYGYRTMRDSGYSWPIIDLQIRYIQPMQYEQNIVVEAGIIEYENYLKIKYEIFDHITKQRLTRGTSKQVAVSIADSEMQLVCPDILRKKLAGYL
ncbi:FIG002571: 4-hydroxybenzoyl-CoA thioesterase domain protein [hydrothermal vent metagenome]|uniref:FIG002571: 4-hydroxybenzoyl-CoA thioesterase domain protein n=1 Tax=hydrothermal vent metagenome TaxID=652676 RepID=A0A3B1AG37_9ZZZZ